MKKLLSVLITASILTSAMSVFASTPAPTAEPTTAPVETTLPTQTPTADETPSPEETVSPDATTSPDATVSPEETTAPTPTPPAHELSTQFIIEMEIQDRKHVIANNACIEVYNSKDELVASGHRYVGWDTEAVTYTFDVPEYRMGDKFKVKLVSGLRSIKYHDEWVEEGGMLEIETYGYEDEEGNYVQNNGCALSGNPHYDKVIRIYAGGAWQDEANPYARIVDGVAMMPVRAIGEAMGLKVKYDPDYDSVVCSVGDKAVIFNANSVYTEIFGTGINAPHETVYIDGSLFVPVRTLAEAFESVVEVADYGEYMDILIGDSPIVQEFRNQWIVNVNGIGSRTNYLVWVSKHEYKVRVFEGSQYHWDLVGEFPCALGAWNTPTITGQFEYIERTQWNYDGYYVGPVLRFHNGYALHSTLLYYGGGEYDGRVGVNISHGCVRLHPQDINWIANTIPFRTRIYITE